MVFSILRRYVGIKTFCIHRFCYDYRLFGDFLKFFLALSNFAIWQRCPGSSFRIRPTADSCKRRLTPSFLACLIFSLLVLTEVLKEISGRESDVTKLHYSFYIIAELIKQTDRFTVKVSATFVGYGLEGGPG